MSNYDLTVKQHSHAPRASSQAFSRNLCADSDGAEHVCEMYGGHAQDIARPYRNEHHCECGHGWT